jgi:hypothetical protein
VRLLRQDERRDDAPVLERISAALGGRSDVNSLRLIAYHGLVIPRRSDASAACFRQ